MLEPKCARDLPVSPETVRDAANQGESGRPRTRLSLRNDFLDELPVFARLSIIQRRMFDDLPASEPHQWLWGQEPARQVEINLIWQSVSKNFVQICRNVGGGGVMGMVVATVLLVWRGKGERKGLDSALDG